MTDVFGMDRVLIGMNRWLVALLLILSVAAHGEEFAVGPGLQGDLEVAAGNGQFLVAWSDGQQVLARRFDDAGRALDPQPLVVGEGRFAQIALASNGVEYFLLWSDNPTNDLKRVRFRFLPTGGELSSTHTPVDGTADNTGQAPVAAAWNGVDFIAAWANLRVWNSATISAALLRADGALTSTVIARDLRTVYGLSISIGGDRDLILYTGFVGDTAGTLAFVDAQVVDRALVSHATLRLDSLQYVSGCMGQRVIVRPDAIWTGGDWIATWVQSTCFLGESNLLARVSRNGVLTSTRVVAPLRQGGVYSDLLLIGGEPALLTEFLDHGTPSEPVHLHLLSRTLAPRAILQPVKFLASTMLGPNRLVLVYNGGDGVTGTIQTVDLPPRLRRRAVR